MSQADESLQGAIDLHVHSAPCVYKRLFDHAELAEEAKRAGMRALLLKSHHLGTADRVHFVRKMVPGIDVFGGITLNYAVGGLNPYAVDAAIRFGAKAVWMPTVDAQYHRLRYGTTGQFDEPGLRVEGELPSFYGKKPGIGLLTDSGDLVPELWDILDLVARADILLICGHQSVAEKETLIRDAKKVGVRRMMVDHPHGRFGVPVDKQRELVSLGAVMNYTYYHIHLGLAPITQVVSEIREVGAENIVLSTDLGQRESPPPPEGLRRFIGTLLQEGIGAEDIDLMVRRNPARLLY